MLIGGRGHGYGSSIKGCKEYDGYWKRNLHAKYATVCVTNENNTSQICLYCFHKLYHPKTANEKVWKNNKNQCKWRIHLI